MLTDEQKEILYAVRDAALNKFAEAHPFPGASAHGPQHWARVNNFGVALCAIDEQADQFVVQLFAAVHDCCRVNDWEDKGHGERAAKWVAEQESLKVALSIETMHLLVTAVSLHDTFAKTSDPTIAACWDADKLDLRRVGVVLQPSDMNSKGGAGMLETIGAHR